MARYDEGIFNYRCRGAYIVNPHNLIIADFTVFWVRGNDEFMASLDVDLENLISDRKGHSGRFYVRRFRRALSPCGFLDLSIGK
jgi:hypothetical protein